MLANRLPAHTRLTLAQRSNLLPITAWAYDLWRERSLSWLTQEPFGLGREFDLMLEWLHAKPGQNALDVGTSTGNCALALAKAGVQVTAIDLSRPMLERAALRIAQAKRQDQITLELANAEALPYPDASFDLLTLGATLNEFASTTNGLLECARVLKPGGKLYLMYLRRSDTPLGRAIQQLFELGQIRFPERDVVRGCLASAGLTLRQAELHRAVTFELYRK